MYVRNKDEKKNSRTGDGGRDRRNDNEKLGDVITETQTGAASRVIIATTAIKMGVLNHAIRVT
ncbi:hypothetical protein EXD76_05245 [BEV proteobacterium]|nr:hypothetical protein [Candidatus Symbiopectobacterium sp. Chty_BC]